MLAVLITASRFVFSPILLICTFVKGHDIDEKEAKLSVGTFNTIELIAVNARESESRTPGIRELRTIYLYIVILVSRV